MLKGSVFSETYGKCIHQQKKQHTQELVHMQLVALLVFNTFLLVNYNTNQRIHEMGEPGWRTDWCLLSKLAVFTRLTSRISQFHDVLIDIP